MKRIWWGAKIAFLSMSLSILLGFDGKLRVATAQRGCDTSIVCSTAQNGQTCYCPDYFGPCNGCFIPNGGQGCGHCARQ